MRPATISCYVVASAATSWISVAQSIVISSNKKTNKRSNKNTQHIGWSSSPCNQTEGDNAATAQWAATKEWPISKAAYMVGGPIRSAAISCYAVASTTTLWSSLAPSVTISFIESHSRLNWQRFASLPCLNSTTSLNSWALFRQLDMLYRGWYEALHNSVKPITIV